jgi:hypothetical protein
MNSQLVGITRRKQFMGGSPRYHDFNESLLRRGGYCLAPKKPVTFHGSDSSPFMVCKVLPSGYVKIDIENGHRNSGFYQ